MTAVVTSPSQLPDSKGPNDPEKVNVWIKGLKEAVEQAAREEPKVRSSEIVKHLRLITGNDDKPIVIWQKEERGSVTLVFERKSDLLDLLEDGSFVEPLGNADTYVALGIVNFGKLTARDFEYDERLRAWVSYSKRHSNEDVKEFNILVLDLDYKGKFEEEGLEKLAEFLAFLKDHGVDFNIAFSGGGFHLYVLLLSSLKPSEWRRYQERFIALGRKFGLPVDEKIKDPARVMRLIGTINWKYDSPRPTFWIKDGALPVSISDLEGVLPSLFVERRRIAYKSPKRSEGVVKESFDPTKWLDSFAKFWREGIRHSLALGIAGTLAKNGVPVSEALELIRAVVERTEDRELEDRVRAVLDTYAAIGYDRELLLKECEEVVDPSLCKFSDREVEVAKLGTIVRENEESFRAFYGEDFSEFLKLVRDFEGQFRKDELVVEGLETPFLLDFNEKAVKAMKKKDWRPLLAAVPTKLIKVEDELYVELQSTSLGLKAFGPTNLGRLAKEIAEELGVWKGSKADAYVKELIASILKSKPKEVAIEERPGVWSGLYWWKGSFVLIDVPKPSEEELEKAFELLMALREYYPNGWRPVFWTLIKWGLVAPMFYALRKRYGRSVQALVLTGQMDSGKSTLARIVVKMGGGKEESADTKVAFAQLVSSGLSPVLIDEGELFVHKLQEDPGYMAVVKRLFSDKVRGVGTPSMKVRSLEPRRTLLITVNEEFHALPQILKRMAAVEFPPMEVRKSEGFERVRRRAEEGLLPLTQWALHEFVEGELWREFEEGGWKGLADVLMEKLLCKFGKEELIEEARAWAILDRKSNEERLVEELIGKLKEELIEELAKIRSAEGLRYASSWEVLRSFKLPHFGAYRDGDKHYLVIFGIRSLLKKFRLQLTPHQAAKYLGGEYFDQKKLREEGAAKVRRSVVIIPFDKLPEDLRALLESEVAEEVAV